MGRGTTSFTKSMWEDGKAKRWGDNWDRFRWKNSDKNEVDGRGVSLDSFQLALEIQRKVRPRIRACRDRYMGVMQRSEKHTSISDTVWRERHSSLVLHGISTSKVYVTVHKHVKRPKIPIICYIRYQDIRTVGCKWTFAYALKFPGTYFNVIIYSLKIYYLMSCQGDSTHLNISTKKNRKTVSQVFSK